MPTLTDIENEIKSLAHGLSERVDTIDREQKALGEALTSKTAQMPAEYKSSFEKMNAEINRLTDQITEMRTEAKRPPLADLAQKDHPGRKAFLRAIQCKGDLSLLSPEEKSYIVPEHMPAERKALYAGDATTGGFFASTDFMAELQAYSLLVSPMRSICRVQQTSGEKVQMPSLANDASAYWATEQSSFTDSTDPTVSMINIPVHEIRGLLKISEQNLEDSLFDLPGFIKQRLGMKFAQTEGTAFIAGTGTGRPRGLFSYTIKASSSYTGGSAGKNNVTDAIAYVPSTVAANITADSVLNVAMDLKEVYDKASTYIFTRATLNTIRLFKDSMNRPLWQPFGSYTLPGTIYNRPYREMPDMDEIGANKYPIAIGDFSHYMIVDRITLNLRQLNELYAAAGLVAFIARKRVGGDVLQPEAFRFLKCATS